MLEVPFCVLNSLRIVILVPLLEIGYAIFPSCLPLSQDLTDTPPHGVLISDLTPRYKILELLEVTQLSIIDPPLSLKNIAKAKIQGLTHYKVDISKLKKGNMEFSEI